MDFPITLITIPLIQWKVSNSFNYRRIPKVTAPVTFGSSRPNGPLLSSSFYFRVAVTFRSCMLLTPHMNKANSNKKSTPNDLTV